MWRRKKMEDKNIYGFISGGKIFDILDRNALDYVREKYNEKDSFVFTTHSRITFYKQLCDLENFAVHVRSDERGMIAGKRWEIYTQMYDAKQVLIAEAFFEFKKADKNFCEIK